MNKIDVKIPELKRRRGEINYILNEILKLNVKNEEYLRQKQLEFKKEKIKTKSKKEGEILSLYREETKTPLPKSLVSKEEILFVSIPSLFGLKEEASELDDVGNELKRLVNRAHFLISRLKKLDTDINKSFSLIQTQLKKDPPLQHLIQKEILNKIEKNKKEYMVYTKKKIDHIHNNIKDF